MLKGKAAHSIILTVLTEITADAAPVMCATVLFAQIVAVNVWAETSYPVANMKNTKKITLCGIVAALAVVVMLTGYFPYLTYAIPAVAGLLMMVPLIECGAGWSFATYTSSAVLIFIIGETESKILYILFLGYYPILKSLIERIRKQLVEWVLKLLFFNAAAVAFYYISSVLFAISYDDFGILGKYGAVIFLALCNIVFVLYDIGISRVASYYMFSLHDKIKKIIK